MYNNNVNCVFLIFKSKQLKGCPCPNETNINHEHLMGGGRWSWVAQKGGAQKVAPSGATSGNKNNEAKQRARRFPRLYK